MNIMRFAAFSSIAKVIKPLFSESISKMLDIVTFELIAIGIVTFFKHFPLKSIKAIFNNRSMESAAIFEPMTFMLPFPPFKIIC